MHVARVPPHATKLATIYRGEHNEIAIDPVKTAHVTIDLQAGFLGAGATLEVLIGRDILANINRVSSAMRAAGGHVVHVQFTYDPDWAPMYGRMTSDARARMAAAFTDGAEEHRLWPGLDVEPQDRLCRKRGSAPSPPAPATWMRSLKPGVSTRWSSPASLRTAAASRRSATPCNSVTMSSSCKTAAPRSQMRLTTLRSQTWSAFSLVT